MAADGVPGMVIALLAGGPIWTAAFGMADPAAGLAMTADALFRVESISKPVTAWGATRLAESGRLDLDAPNVATPAAPPPFMVRLSASTSRAGGASDSTPSPGPGNARPTAAPGRGRCA